MLPARVKDRDELYIENQSLRRQLKAFLAQARINEQKMRRFQSQELRLISLSSLVELLQVILYEYRTSFELDVVTLALIDPSFEVQHILEDEGFHLDDHPDLIVALDTEDLDALYGPTATPRLGRYCPSAHGALFGHLGHPPASIALVPLIRYGELIGSLNLGSFRDERFVTGSGTDFLERLAAIVAISLENAANHERLKRVGVTDFLTGINNRRFFDQRYEEELGRAGRSGAPLSCLLLDIDNFKKINDTHGHRAGDQVLKEIAALIRKQLRGSDVLARFGGEEFVTLLLDTPADTALEIAERIRTAVAAHAVGIDRDTALSVTISIGLATLTGTDLGEDPCGATTDFIERTDQALYTAKRTGKNRVVQASCGSEG